MPLTIPASAAAQFADRLLYERDLLSRAILSDRQKPRQSRWQPVGDSGRTSPSRVDHLHRRWYPGGGFGPAAMLYHAAVSKATGPGWVDVRQALTAAWEAHQALTNEALNGGGTAGYTWGPAFSTHCKTLMALLGLLPAIGKVNQQQPNPERPSKEALALAVLSDHPDWSDTEIAKSVGCHRTSLYRFKKFQRAKAILQTGKDALPRGSKFPDKGMEAWHDEGDG